MSISTIRTALSTALQNSTNFAAVYNFTPSDKAPRTPALILQWKGTDVERLTVARLGEHRTNRAKHRLDVMIAISKAGQVPALENDRDAYVDILTTGLTYYSTLSGAAVDVEMGTIRPAGFQWEDATVYGLACEVSVTEDF